MKKASIFLLIVVVCGVLFLTFQGPTQTMHLSEKVREWVGYNGDGLQFRSDVHLVEYFIVGLAVAAFGLCMNWKTWKPGVIGCGFGLLDEVIKIALPTREFGTVDLIKDFIGVWVAIAIVYEISRLSRKNVKAQNQKW